MRTSGQNSVIGVLYGSLIQSKCLLDNLAEFFTLSFRKKESSPRTIAVYRTAIAGSIRSIGGLDFSHDAALSAMIRNVLV